VRISPALWEGFFTVALAFVTGNPEVLAIMVAGAVVGLIAFAVKKLSKAGR